jgi:hypothetical protein
MSGASQQPPHWNAPEGHWVALVPCAQVTWQLWTLLQVTAQVPVHSTLQVLALVQVTWLPSPTLAAHSGELLQSHLQLSPQMTPQLLVLSQVKRQFEPQDCEQSCTL